MIVNVSCAYYGNVYRPHEGISISVLIIRERHRSPVLINKCWITEYHWQICYKQVASNLKISGSKLVGSALGKKGTKPISNSILLRTYTHGLTQLITILL